MFYAFFMSSYDGDLRFKNKYFFACNDNIFHTFANGIMVLLPCK